MDNRAKTIENFVSNRTGVDRALSRKVERVRTTKPVLTLLEILDNSVSLGDDFEDTLSGLLLELRENRYDKHLSPFVTRYGLETSFPACFLKGYFEHSVSKDRKGYSKAIQFISSLKKEPRWSIQKIAPREAAFRRAYITEEQLKACEEDIDKINAMVMSAASVSKKKMNEHFNKDVMITSQCTLDIYASMLMEDLRTSVKVLTDIREGMNLNAYSVFKRKKHGAVLVDEKEKKIVVCNLNIIRKRLWNVSCWAVSFTQT